MRRNALNPLKSERNNQFKETKLNHTGGDRLLQIRNLSKAFGDRTLFSKIDLDIKRGDCIGLVGYNGTGKTTLASIIAGVTPYDEGSIQWEIPHYKIGYLQQAVGGSLEDEIESMKMKEGFLTHTSQLGLQKVKFWSNEDMQQVSSGEHLKLKIANIWSNQPELLILDEPTNHMDFQGVTWLIEELRKFNGAILIISHDRYFLDETVNQIVEIEDDSINLYRGNYTSYNLEKAQKRKEQLHLYQHQEQKKRSIQKQISQLKSWSDKAHHQASKQGSASERRQMGLKEFHGAKAKKIDKRIKSKIKRLEQSSTSSIEKPKEDPKIYFDFQGTKKRGKRIIEATQLSKHYQNRNLFTSASFYINNGERFGIVGANGTGKTTLCKMIMGEVYETSGELWVSSSLNIGYLSQDVSDLPYEMKAIDALGYFTEEGDAQNRTILANMGLSENLLQRKVRELSLGERTKLKLAKILVQKVDLLLLDEPTNHLDLPSREQLERTLEDFTGTLLTISHDRYFLSKLCNKLLVLENNKIQRLEMNFKEYKEHFHAKAKKNQLTDELLVIETKLSAIIGKLSLVEAGHKDYEHLDESFHTLLKKKRTLQSQIVDTPR